MRREGRADRAPPQVGLESCSTRSRATPLYDFTYPWLRVLTDFLLPPTFPKCSELRSLERLNNASGNADTFEAVLAEEMHTMRESFEQKIASLKAQMERDTAAFSRERKEMRESYDKDAKAMKRQIELLQVSANTGLVTVRRAICSRNDALFACALTCARVVGR